MPEDFRGLEAVAAPDFWAPLSALGQFRPGRWSAQSPSASTLSDG